MARKLKSDRVLFIATILLVGLSIVMVYSASAVVALERMGRPSLFLIKQGMWAALGMAVLGVVMRVDYRTYREPAFIWSCLAVVVIGLIAVLFSPPVNNARRWFAIGGLGVQPSELAKLSAIFFIAALLERRMHRINEIGYSLVPIGMVVACLVGLIMLEPDFGTSMSLVLVAGVMVFAAGLNYTYLAGAVLVALPAVAVIAMGAPYRRRRLLAFLNPWEDPLGDGFQIIPVADRGRHRRRLGPRADERRAEAVLPARAAHRFHLLGHLRGARAHRRHRRADLLLRDHVARASVSRFARRTASARFSRSG